MFLKIEKVTRDNAIPVVTCEGNMVTPSEPSRLIHEKFDNREQGTRWVANGTMHVSPPAALA
jgi:hypothetical protein